MDEEKPKINRHCCLYRLNCLPEQEHKYIILDSQDRVSLGRADTCTVRLTESKAISRCHAILEKQPDGQWSVKDCKSGNGVYVNNKQLMPDTAHVLRDRQVLELGRDANNTQQTYYRFQYYVSAKVVTKDQTTGNLVDVEQRSSAAKNTHYVRRHLGASPSTLLRDKIRQHEKWLKQEMSQKMAENEEKQSLLLAESEAMKERLQSSEAMRLDYEQKLREMQDLCMERENNLASVIKENQAENQKSMVDQKMEMDTLHDHLTQQFLTREQQIKRDMGSEMENIKQEKLKMEEMVHTHSEQEGQLLNTIKDLNAEKCHMTTVVAEVKRETERLVNVEARTKHEMISSLEDLVDSELVCSICSELFVQATSLGCSHSFCKLCIHRWMKQKKECPICRQKIKSNVRSIVLDNYIDRVIEMLSEDTRTCRKTTLETRKQEQKAWDDEIAARENATAARETATAARETARAQRADQEIWVRNAAMAAMSAARHTTAAQAVQATAQRTQAQLQAQAVQATAQRTQAQTVPVTAPRSQIQAPAHRTVADERQPVRPSMQRPSATVYSDSWNRHHVQHHDSRDSRDNRDNRDSSRHQNNYYQNYRTSYATHAAYEPHWQY